MNVHVAPDTCVCFGEMFRAKLIRSHRTELTSANMLACIGRPWLGLPVGSLMHITKVGRLCACGYPGPISGDSLENQLFIAQSPFGTSLFSMRWPFAMRWQVCLEDTGLPKA